MKRPIFGLLFLAAAMMSGCAETEQSTASLCTAGEEELCKCDGGLNGTRVCLPSTLGYTQCDCFGGGNDGGTSPPLPDSSGDDVSASDVELDAADTQGPAPLDTVEDADVANDVADVLEPPQDSATGDTFDADPIEDALPQDGSIDATADTEDAPDIALEDADGQGPEDVSQDVSEDTSDQDTPTGPVSCETNEDCDDDNPCTDEVCMVAAGVCVYDSMWTDGFACEADENPCTTDDTCVAGECLVGEPVDCSALDSDCGVGVCVPAGPEATECVSAPANEGFPCDDSSVCTVEDACSGGLCVGAAVACQEDDDPCTEASCDAVTGCAQAPALEGTPCDDGDPCTEGDLCQSATCAGSPLACPGDNNSCTLDVCVAEEGGCVHVNQPDGTLCQDGQGCTLNDTCVAGSCEPGPLKPCDTGDPCTLDMCDFVTGDCATAPIAGCDAALTPCDPDAQTPCEDGICDTETNACVPCLVSEDCGIAGLACLGKQCVPAVSCEATEGCAVVDGICDEGSSTCVECLSDEDCLEGALCVAGACQAEPPVVCSADACLGLLHFLCVDGGTKYVAPITTCDDGNICTDDYCSATLGCVHTNNDEPCDDGDACTSDDTCGFGNCTGVDSVICVDTDPCDGLHACDPETGACVNGDPILCDDSMPCNGVESCDPTTGDCVPGDPVVCDDEDACNGLEACDEGTGDCLPGEPVICDDGLQCNGVETCETETGSCIAGEALECSDGEACNGFETCDVEADKCVPGIPIECSDGDACNGVEECYGPGFCTAPEDVVCADENLCDGTETCDPATGACQDGAPLDCDDEDPCTNDYCTPEIGCSNIYIPACDEGLCDAVECEDLGSCVENTCNPSNGQCEQEDVDCDDLNPCTVDTCNPDAAEGDDACVHTIDPDCTPCTENAGCDDGDLCTVDQCDLEAAVCDFSVPVVCEDDNTCSEDTCLPDEGCVHTAIKPCPDLACEFDFECNNESACTVDTCEIEAGAATGDCVHTPIECDDGDPCHVGACDPNAGIAGACVFEDIDCDDGNLCTLDSCGDGPDGGCAYETNPCEDGDPCTSDSCDALTQECEHAPIEGCVP